MTIRSATLALAAILGLATSANALTITFSDGTNSARITDQDFGPSAPNTHADLNGVVDFVEFSSITVGNFSVNGDLFGGFSPVFSADVLTQGAFSVNNTGTGTETLTMTISQDNYAFGAGASASYLGFALAHSGLSTGDSVSASSWVNDSNALFAMEDPIGTALALVGDGSNAALARANDIGNLVAPFSMTTRVVFTTVNGGSAEFTTLTAVKPVPLPAGIALLLTALGGLGFAARRRAAA